MILNLTCAYCENAIEVDDGEVEQDDIVTCDVCGVECVFWHDTLVTVDEAYEYECDLFASRSYGERLCGRRDGFT
jgi:hypothetical protein